VTGEGIDDLLHHGHDVLGAAIEVRQEVNVTGRP